MKLRTHKPDFSYHSYHHLNKPRKGLPGNSW